jgi:hypothetical protein
MGGHKSDDTSIYFITELLADASTTYTDSAYEFVYFLEGQAQNCDIVPADLLLLRSPGENIADTANF